MNQGYIDIFKHDSKLKIKMSSEEREEWNVTPHAVHEAQILDSISVEVKFATQLINKNYF